MKKILFIAILVILVGAVIFAQVKQTSDPDQGKQEKQKPKAVSTQPAQSAQPMQTKSAAPSVQPAKDAPTTQTTPTKPTKRTKRNSKATQTTQPTQPSQSTQSTQPTQQSTRPGQQSQPEQIILTPQAAQSASTTQGTQPVQSIQTTVQTTSTPSDQVNTTTNLQEQPAPPETNIGRVYIPRDFVHVNKDYPKGNYYISLYEKDGIPWFKVYNNSKEFLFEELAVVKPYEAKVKRTKLRVRKEFLKDYEYFRVMVIKPDSHLMLYFMIKQKEVPATEPIPAENPEEKKVEEVEL